MSEFAYPLGGKQDYTSAQAGAFHGTRTSGVWSGEDNLKVTITGARQLTLSKGIAWFTTEEYWGKVYVNTADINFTLPVADAVLDRICRLVIRWDKTANTATAQLLMGDLGSSPTAPARSKTDELYDLVLCDYLVAHGDLAATAANLTDQRLNEDLCGLMRDGVTRIPTAAWRRRFLRCWISSARPSNRRQAGRSQTARSQRPNMPTSPSLPRSSRTISRIRSSVL